MPLEVLPSAVITHTTQRVDIIGSSSQKNIHSEHAEAEHQRQIPEESLELIDWEKIHLQLLEYKQEKRFHNLIFDTQILKRILSPNEEMYKLSVMKESEVVPTSLAELEHLEELVLTLLRKYIAKFYGIIQKRWNAERVQLKRLDENDANFTDWSVYIPRNEANEMEPRIGHLMENGEIYEAGSTTLSEVHGIKIVYNDRHLYQPLLAIDAADTAWRTTPPALEDSEKQFVDDLRSYIRQQSETLLESKKIFFLRNQSRGKGIGFYQNEGFYPDFILWITDEANQRIVFIEPHGMVYEAVHEDNPKINLFKRLRKISHQRFGAERVHMDAFIISTTDFAKLRLRYPNMDKQDFKDWHILFPNSDDPAYLSPIFEETYTENE